jgi:dodecin
MAVVKIIELLAESTESWEAATQVAVSEASKSIHHIKNVYIQDFKAFVEDGKIVRYRVNARVSFVVHD